MYAPLTVDSSPCLCSCVVDGFAYVNTKVVYKSRKHIFQQRFVASLSCRTDSVENTASQLGTCWLATVMFTESLIRYGSVCYNNIFLTSFQYSYMGVKFKYTYRGRFVRKVAYTRHDAQSTSVPVGYEIEFTPDGSNMYGYSSVHSMVISTLVCETYMVWSQLCLEFFFYLQIWGVESRSTRHCGHLMAYCVSPGWLW
jgi:hypothetical protein